MRKGRPRGDRPSRTTRASVRPRASVAKQLRPCLRLARRQLVPHRRPRQRRTRVHCPIAEQIWLHDGWGLAPSVGASLSGGIQREAMSIRSLCCVFVIVRVNDLPHSGNPIMNEYSFEVGVRAVVRVQASDPDTARKVVETVLGAPGSQEIELANRNNQGLGRDATVTAVDFVQKTPAKLVADKKKRPTSA